MFENLLEGEIRYLQFEVWRRRYIQELSKAGIDEIGLGMEFDFDTYEYILLMTRLS